MRRILIVLLVLASTFLYSEQTSIFDVQFATSFGSDGTYPSSFHSQKVSLSGIVTAIDSQNNGLFLSHPDGGKWNGIFVANHISGAQIGDHISLDGEIFEQFGFTTLRFPKNLQVISKRNQLPQPVLVTTRELSVSECYEGVLVQLSNVTVVGESGRKGVYLIDDGSGACRLSDSFISLNPDKPDFHLNDNFSSIIGVVDYRYGEYRINPRDTNDIKKTYVGVSKPSWGRIKSLYR